MSKTAMMNLIAWLDEIDNSPAALTSSDVELKMIKQFKAKAESYIEEEKRNILIARASVYSEIMNIPLNGPLKWCEEYYDKNYKK